MSNHVSDGSIASGSDRAHTGSTYYVGGGGLNTHSPSPESDYIMNNLLSDFVFTQIRSVAWGLKDHSSGTYSYTGDWDQWRRIIIPCTSTSCCVHPTDTGVSVAGTGTFADVYVSEDAYMADGMRGNDNCNSNQLTIGMAGRNGCTTCGTYFGHGVSEGSFEGSYDAGGGHDGRGKADFVR